MFNSVKTSARRTHFRIWAGAGLALVMGVSATAVSADDDVDDRRDRPALRTVSQVLKNPIDDHDVRLEGRIIRRISDDTYLFRDNTGDIRIDLDDDDDDDFRSRNLRNVKVVITGEIERNRRSAPEIDVDDIYVR